jgi:ubiquinone/menaquinone biosynthesis C-methylase UbiE
MSAPSNYVLGRSEHEYERLTLQAKILRPYTESYFRRAGVTAGMRVLDLGSGMGDVALLAAEIVGPGGRVVGIDRDAAALQNATRRAAENGCSSWLSFQAVSLDDFTASEPFDAIVGRYILLYQSDPSATIRALLRYLKPGGVVVFHEIDFPDPTPSDPPCALFDQVYGLVGAAFSRAGAPPHYGRRVATAFTGAGLPFPTVIADGIIGGGPGSYVYPWVANTFISIAPRLKELGLEMPSGFTADETLAARVEAAVLASGSQVMAPTQYGAWTRKPL